MCALSVQTLCKLCANHLQLCNFVRVQGVSVRLIVCKKKEYVIPENKMVSIGALRSPKDAFVIMDISDTKKIHFGNDPVSSMLIFMTMLIIL